MIKTADWVIDLGPEGGAGGGEVVAAGTPEQVATCEASFTGQALQPVLVAEPKPTHAKPAKANGRTRKRRRAASTHLDVQGAQQHNLKNITVALPREQMTVFCGPSGSGKSVAGPGHDLRRGPAALRRIAVELRPAVPRPGAEAEGRARHRPVAGHQHRAEDDEQEPALDRRHRHRDLRLPAHPLRPARPAALPDVRHPDRHADGRRDHRQDAVTARGDEALPAWPRSSGKGQEKYDTLWDEIRRAGFVRMRVDGKSYNVDEPPAIDHRRKHRVEVVVDRIVVRREHADAARRRGRAGARPRPGRHARRPRRRPTRTSRSGRSIAISQHLACDKCGRSFEPLNPHHFSFNSPLGWCPTCEGLGVQHGANPALLIRDPTLSLRDGRRRRLAGARRPSSRSLPFAEALARHAGFSLDTPFDELDAAAAAGDPARHRRRVDSAADATRSDGRRSTFQYKGLFPAIDEASRVSFVYRQRLDHLVNEVPCSACHGSRLRDDAAAVRFARPHARRARATGRSARRSQFFKDLKLSKQQQQVAGELLREITQPAASSSSTSASTT